MPFDDEQNKIDLAELKERYGSESSFAKNDRANAVDLSEIEGNANRRGEAIGRERVKAARVQSYKETHEADLGDHSSAMYRQLYAPAYNTGANLFGPAARVAAYTSGLVGAEGTSEQLHDIADAANHSTQAADEIAADTFDDTWVPNFIERGAQSALTTLPTMMAMGGPVKSIATIGAQVFDDSITEARDLGMTDIKQIEYATKQAAIETGITAVFQKFAPGFEGMWGKQATKEFRKGFGAAVRQWSKQTAQELPEEIIIELMHNVVSGDSVDGISMGLDPTADDPANQAQTAFDTTMGVLATGALGSAVTAPLSASQKYADRRVREQFTENPEAQGGPPQFADPDGDMLSPEDRTLGLAPTDIGDLVAAAQEEAGTSGKDVETIIQDWGYLPELIQDDIDAGKGQQGTEPGLPPGIEDIFDSFEEQAAEKARQEQAMPADSQATTEHDVAPSTEGDPLAVPIDSNLSVDPQSTQVAPQDPATKPQPGRAGMMDDLQEGGYDTPEQSEQSPEQSAGPSKGDVRVQYLNMVRNMLSKPVGSREANAIAEELGGLEAAHPEWIAEFDADNAGQMDAPEIPDDTTPLPEQQPAPDESMPAPDESTGDLSVRPEDESEALAPLVETEPDPVAELDQGNDSPAVADIEEAAPKKQIGAKKQIEDEQAGDQSVADEMDAMIKAEMDRQLGEQPDPQADPQINPQPDTPKKDQIALRKPGSIASMEELRNEARDLSKKEFDAKLQQMERDGVIDMTVDPDPGQLTPEQKEQRVTINGSVMDKVVFRTPQTDPPKPPKKTAKKPIELNPSKDPVDGIADYLSEGGKFGTIVDARKAISARTGEEIKPQTPQAKAAEEVIERGVVKAAKRIVSQATVDNSTPRDTFDQLVDLYHRQPNLKTKTSESQRLQAYSTPVPLAYIASVEAGVKPGDTVYDPAAGNGALLIAADNAIANELGPERFAALQADGIEATQEDATSFRPTRTPDVIIANPPFSKDPDNNRHKWTADGIQTTEIDHAVTLNALQSLPKDGRAVIILGSRGFEAGEPGSNKKRGNAYSNQKAFYDKMYDDYNVTDHYTVDGSLYSRQGAGFPVDMIVINGRNEAGTSSARPKPYNYIDGGLPKLYKTWSDLADAKINRKEEADTGPADRRAVVDDRREPASDDSGARSRSPDQQGADRTDVEPVRRTDGKQDELDGTREPRRDGPVRDGVVPEDGGTSKPRKTIGGSRRDTGVPGTAGRTDGNKPKPVPDDSQSKPDSSGEYRGDQEPKGVPSVDRVDRIVLSKVAEVASQKSDKNRRLYISDILNGISVSKSEMADSLMRMERDGLVTLFPLDDPREITAARREGEIFTPAGSARHILYLESGGLQRNTENHAQAKVPSASLGEIDGDGEFQVASIMRDGREAGKANFGISGTTGKIADIYMHEGQKGGNAMKQVYPTIEARLQSQGATKIRLSTVDDAVGEKVWKPLGFSVVKKGPVTTWEKPLLEPSSGSNRADEKPANVPDSDRVTSDLDAMIKAEMDRQLGEQAEPRKALGKKKPATEQTKPRKRSEVKRDEAAKSLQEGKDLIRQLMDDIKKSPSSGLNPAHATTAVRAAIKFANAGIKTFDAYASTIVEAFGNDSQFEEIKPYLESAWNELHDRGMVDDKAGKIEDKPAEKPAKPEPKEIEVKADPAIDGTEFQAEYKTTSKQKSVDTLVPVNQQDATAEAMANIVDTHGDIDVFVSKELGYKPKDLGKYFSAEQVDALAMAIDSHKAGQGFVIGDSTGVGKGRFVAGMMVYATRQGLIPVFVTEKSSLYADMIRDLTDIGQNPLGKQFEPLLTNALRGKDKVDLNGAMKPAEQEKYGRRLAGHGPAPTKSAAMEAIESLRKGGKFKGRKTSRKGTSPTTFNAVFTNYSQMTTSRGKQTWRHDFLRELAPNAFFILDESHNAGGSEQRGNEDDGSPLKMSDFVREIVGDGKGAVFSSATFAKRPDVMSLYANTGIQDAFEDIDNIQAVLEQGGVPLQQVLSEAMAKAGRYIRRERSFAGVKMNTKVVKVNRESLDQTSTVFRSVQDFDVAKWEAMDKPDKAGHTPVDHIISQGGMVGLDNATGKAGVDSTQFSSKLWNLVDNMLLSAKADQVADQAIQAFKEGKKPVIAIDKTMESALENYLEDHPAEDGDVIDYSMKSLYQMYLDRTREVILKRDKADKKSWERVRLTDEQLGPKGLAAYNRAKKQIASMKDDMPASPIDYIRNRLKEAGLNVGEITGRSVTVDYSTGQPRLSKRDPTEIGNDGKLRQVNAFNDGTLDVILLNRSGSTGLSLHANEGFTDQKPRHMIIAEAAKNIDTFMQMIGRIHRTGQTTLPSFDLLMSNAPAETRPASVLVKKLSSLNASVTASASGDVQFDAPDLINTVGDKIVLDYMRERLSEQEDAGESGDPQLDLFTVLDVRKPDGQTPPPGFAKKVTGRVVLLPVDQQKQIWKDITKSFTDRIDQLNKVHRNPLVASTVDLDAKVLEQATIFEGVEGDSPFTQPAYLQAIDAKRTIDLMKPAEIREAIDKSTGGEVPAQWARETITKLVQDSTDYIAEKSAAMSDAAATGFRTTAGKNLQTTSAKIRALAPGTPVSLWSEADGMSALQGVVLRISKTGKSKDPAAPGSWVVDIATLDEHKKISVPLSKIGAKMEDGIVIDPSLDTLDDLIADFEGMSADRRETRYVGTGNILAAFSVLAPLNGNIVFYKDNDGKTQRGVLLPRSFEMKKWQDQLPVVFKDAAEASDFLQDGGTLGSPGRMIQAVIHKGELVLRAPRSRNKAGKFLTNKGILDASGSTFVTGSNPLAEMRVPLRNMEATMRAVLELTPLQTVLDSQKESARQHSTTMHSFASEDSGYKDPSRFTHDIVESQRSVRDPVDANGKPIKKKKDQESISRQQLRDVAQRIFGITIRDGRVPSAKGGKVKGVYDGLLTSEPVARSIRMHGSNPVDTLTILHEMGHHLDRQTGLTAPTNTIKKRTLPKGLEQQMMGLDYDGTRSGTNAEQLSLSEGFAEFVRIYITEPTVYDPHTNKPISGPLFHSRGVTKWFQDVWMKENPKLASQVRRMRKYAQQENQMSLFSRVREMMGDRPDLYLSWKDRLSEMGSRALLAVQTTMYDKKYKIEHFDQAARENGWLGENSRDVSQRFQYAAYHETSQALEHGPRDIRTGAKLFDTGGLFERVAQNTNNKLELAEAEEFAHMRHVVFMANKNPAYIRPEQLDIARRYIAEIRKDREQYQRYLNHARTISDYAHEILWMRVKAGTLSRESFDRIIEVYGDNYFPMMRIMKGSRGAMRSKSSRSVMKDYYGVKGRSHEGSDLPVKSPMQSLQEMTMEYYQKAAKAQVVRSLYDIADNTEGMGGLVQQVSPVMKPTKIEIVKVLDQLIKTGVIGKDDARAGVIAAQLLGKLDGETTSADMEWFADRHGWIDPTSAELKAAAMGEAQVDLEIEIWNPDYSRSDKDAIDVRVMPDGSKRLYQWEPRLYDVLTGFTGGQLDAFSRFIKKTFSQPFKLAVVGLSGSFATSNIIADYLFYQGGAQNVKGIGSATKPIANLPGLAKHRSSTMAGGDQKNQSSQYILMDELAGNTMSIVSPAPRKLAKSARKAIGKVRGQQSDNLLVRAAKLMGSTVAHPLRDIETVIALSDMPPRIAEMVEAVKQGTDASGGFVPLKGGKWKSLRTGTIMAGLPSDIRTKAFMALAEGTVNFGRSGSFMQYVDAYIPLSVATINANVKYANLLRKAWTDKNKKGLEGHRARRTIAWHAIIAATAYGLAMAQKGDDDRDEAEEWFRKTYYSFGKDGTTTLKVPMDRSTAWLSLAVENLVRDNPDDSSVLSVIIADLFDRIPSGGGPIVGALENFANHDKFRDREIEPSYMSDYLSSDRYDDNTPAMSIAAGQFLQLPNGEGISPMKFTHFMDSWTGNYYSWSAKTVPAAKDVIDRVMTGEADWDDVPGLSDLPGASRIFEDRHQSASWQNFYDSFQYQAKTLNHLKKEADPKAMAGLPELEKMNRMEAYGDALANQKKMTAYRGLMGNIQGSARESGKDPYRHVPYLVGLAREAMDRPPRESSPNPFSISDPPEELMSILKDYARKQTNESILQLGHPQFSDDMTAEDREAVESRRRGWEDVKHTQLEWLKKHKNSPAVKAVVREAASSDRYRRLMKPPRRKIGDRASTNKYRENLRKRNEARAAVAEILN